jgi:cellobiose phosphorylase
MRYGFFDDANKEYVIERPDTPRSWSNYLGSTEYGAIITNNAGGYSFFHSAAQGRFTRMQFNSIPMDQPGRYIYLRDKDSKDYWSASWQPVGKPLDTYKSQCRHGTAYTVITSEYADIKSEILYFVPLGRHFECWNVKVTNSGKKKRKLSLFTYVEYAGNWLVHNDLVNLQYSQYIIKMQMENGIIDHGINVNIPTETPVNFRNADQGRHTFFTVLEADIAGFDTDREVFIGPYRTYADPIVVEQGECTGSLAAGDNGCGTIQVDLDLEPGETREFTVLMGIGQAKVEGIAAKEEFDRPGVIQKEFEKVKHYWHTRMEALTVDTPDPQFNSMMNMWNPFNALMTYAWSRAASLVYSGERDGLGYRDTVQDMMGVLHNIPEEAGKRLELMITGQCANGGAMPVVKHFDHKPGKETPPKPEAFRSDDALWLFNAVPAYVKETGHLDFYEKVLPYADEGEDTVLGHLRRALQFNMERSGSRGLPCGLFADWNDCLELGHNGESLFVAFQLRFGFKTYIDICRMLGNRDQVRWAEEHLETLDKNIDEHGWDGEWYCRAYRYDGMVFGSKENDEGIIFLNPQSWSVLSGHADEEKARKAMDSVHTHLATQYGIALCDPFVKTDPTVIKATLYNPSMKENGAIFNHAQGWAVMAEAMLGNGNRAYEYIRAYLPASFNDKAEIRQHEPYVYSQTTHGKFSPRFGAARLPWLTGTATWAYYSAMHDVLGIQPHTDGLKIDPCIPSHWKEFSVKRRFRGKTIHIKVTNPNAVQKGVKKLIVNGEEVEGNVIEFHRLNPRNDVETIMG